MLRWPLFHLKKLFCLLEAAYQSKKAHIPLCPRGLDFCLSGSLSYNKQRNREGQEREIRERAVKWLLPREGNPCGVLTLWGASYLQETCEKCPLRKQNAFPHSSCSTAAACQHLDNDPGRNCPLKGKKPLLISKKGICSQPKGEGGMKLFKTGLQLKRQQATEAVNTIEAV